MQRKNHILKQHRGMAMLMAISVIVILGTIMALSLSMSTQSVKKTLNHYLHEQAILLTRSAMEQTLLEISGTNRNVACINSYNLQYPNAGAPIFDINVTVQYIGLGAIALCNDYIPNIQTPESNATVLMDVIVSDNPSLGLTEPIRYHRRTLQKL